MASRRQKHSAWSNRSGLRQVNAVASRIQEDKSFRLRRSARLNDLRTCENNDPKGIRQVSPQARQAPCRRLQTSREHAVQPSPREACTQQTNGRKRVREERNPEDRKRRRTSHTALVPEDTLQDTLPLHVDIDPIDYWRRSGYRWPQGDWQRKSMDKDPAMNHLLARKRSSSSLRRKRSESQLGGEQSSTTPSDQKSREAKSAPYRDARYETLIKTKGSFMGKYSLGISNASKNTCHNLLEMQQSLPGDTLFRDDLFEETCEAIRNRNESRVIWDISKLITPSAESLAVRGDKSLRCLIESVNEGWSNSVPFTPTRPQPDHAVGFRREAFTEEQLAKLQPFVGDLTDQSFFMATYYLYFPFLTCEVKCGAVALDVADRQNAHSMTIAVRAVVELFRLVHREKELDREILAFSISHDHRSVRIYGHYAVIEGKKTAFYRHPIKEFSFTSEDGKDKWTAYKFTKSVYRTWMPTHFERLCSAIDALPANVNFELSQQSELHFSEHTGLSQDLSNQTLSVSNTESAERDDDSLLQPLDEVRTPDTSFTRESTKIGIPKAKRGRR